jgi:uncharacterized protein (TIGR03083 family)
MDDHQVWSAIDDQRRRVVALLEPLTEAQWDHPSLCEGWSVRDVGAHLTLQQLTVGDVLRFASRQTSLLLDRNRFIHESARPRAGTWSTDEIVAKIRAPRSASAATASA